MLVQITGIISRGSNRIWWQGTSCMQTVAHWTSFGLSLPPMVSSSWNCNAICCNSSSFSLSLLSLSQFYRKHMLAKVEHPPNPSSPSFASHFSLLWPYSPLRSACSGNTPWKGSRSNLIQQLILNNPWLSYKRHIMEHHLPSNYHIPAKTMGFMDRWGYGEESGVNRCYRNFHENMYLYVTQWRSRRKSPLDLTLN